MAPVVGYWKIRGLAQPIRLLLAYTETEFTEKHYTLSPTPPHIEKSVDWMADKYNLGLKIPNLPYYIDGDIRITQSNAILYYLGRKYNLCGKNELERIEVDLLFFQVQDIIRFYWEFVSEKFDTHKEQYRKDVDKRLKILSDYMGNSKFLLGDKVTLPDFPFYNMLDVHLKLIPDILKEKPNLQEFHRRMEELPGIKKFMASPRFINVPINGPSVKWDVKET